VQAGQSYDDNGPVPLPWHTSEGGRAGEGGVTPGGAAAAHHASLLLPDSARDPQLELLPGPAGEEQGHVAVDDEAVEAVPHLLVAISDAPGCALPCQLPPVPAYLQAVAEVPGLTLFAHETKKCHVYRGHPQQECLEVEAEVLPKTLENSEHPCSVLHFVRVGLHVTVVKGAAFMQVHLMVVYEMGHEHRNITCNQALRTCVWTTVWPEPAKLLVLKFVLVRMNLGTAQALVFAWELN